MMHRTGHTDSSDTVATSGISAERRSEAPRTTPEPQFDPAPGTTPETGHTTAPGTDGTRTTGTDGTRTTDADRTRSTTGGTDRTSTTTGGTDRKQTGGRGPAGGTGAQPASRPVTAAASSGRPAVRPEVSSAGQPLLPAEEQDTLTRRMQQAVSDFVESPRQAVEEAESTFDRIVADLTEALEERKHVLRSSWHTEDTEARTEELRVALQQYRDVSERLLRI
ncbi:hypothetical protein AB0K86_28990 [Streptomyces clavifer]|uniref:hypothetical protein n=1 Tax=Streptomyces TaxID=1883 RepID=UPI000AE8CBCB|nr:MULTISPECIES: hypothetical protein [unclassified Streptomyces]